MSRVRARPHPYCLSALPSLELSCLRLASSARNMARIQQHECRHAVVWRQGYFERNFRLRARPLQSNSSVTTRFPLHELMVTLAIAGGLTEPPPLGSVVQDHRVVAR